MGIIVVENELTAKAKSGDLVSVVLHFDKKFTEHTRDEMARYGEILNKVDDTNERLNNLMTSWSALTDKFEQHEPPCTYLTHVQGAFLKDDDGGIDAAGHRYDHKNRKEGASENKKLSRQIFAVVLGAACISVGAWTFMAMKNSAYDDFRNAQAQQPQLTAKDIQNLVHNAVHDAIREPNK